MTLGRFPSLLKGEYVLIFPRDFLLLVIPQKSHHVGRGVFNVK